jgi:hypothetical protein
MDRASRKLALFLFLFGRSTKETPVVSLDSLPEMRLDRALLMFSIAKITFKEREP